MREDPFMKKKRAQNSGRTACRFAKGNQHRFRPGQRGNPSGRPKKDIAAEIAQRVFEENADAIYRAMLKALLKGDPEVFVVLADRAFGKLTLKVEIPGLENLPDLIVEARKRRGGNQGGRAPLQARAERESWRSPADGHRSGDSQSDLREEP